MRKYSILLTFIAVLSACQMSASEGDPVPASVLPVDSSEISSTVELPFENPFPKRWNPSNDGTSFEPCVAYTDDELVHFQVDPKSIEDAAKVDGQGIRGCAWFMPGKFSLGVVVTNAESLAQYKSGKAELLWQPNLVIGGRSVGLAKLGANERTCMTYVESEGSIVVTDVAVYFEEVRSQFDPCQIAIDFTSAYLDKIPA